MELNFETKTVRAFREGFRQTRRTQLSMEQVVPDVNDDIGRIYAIQPSVLLKSKDVTARGAAITGELHVALLYINELENKVFDLHATQSFSLEYDLPEPDPELLTQIRLFVCSAEARALNPRKVSITVEVGGEMSAFAQENYTISASVTPAEMLPIFTKQVCCEQTLINAVCEKTFVLNEQFPFLPGKPNPERLVSQKISFHISDQQLVGSKVLIKGSVCVAACYLSSETDYPSTADFSAPFSQLIDIGQETMDSCVLQIEATSLYVNLIDTISGEKALDAEIHAVLQLVSRYKQPNQYISDAYSPQYPSVLQFEEWTIAESGEPENLILEADESLELPEDCEDVLSIICSLSPCTLTEKKLEINVVLDVLYRNKDQALASARRMLPLGKEMLVSEICIREARLLETGLRNEKNILSGKFRVEVTLFRCKEEKIQRAVSMTVQEDAPYNTSELPSITAVRVDSESVWDLAKQYHSSCEKIEAINDLDGSLKGKMVLIPKAI